MKKTVKSKKKVSASHNTGRLYDCKLNLQISKKDKENLIKGCKARGLSVSQLIRLVASIL